MPVHAGEQKPSIPASKNETENKVHSGAVLIWSWTFSLELFPGDAVIFRNSRIVGADTASIHFYVDQLCDCYYRDFRIQNETELNK